MCLRNLVYIVLGLILFCFPRSTTSSVTSDLTGEWNVKSTPTSGRAACPEYQSEWSLIQSGTAISGSFVWHSCIAPDSTGAITGTINGNNVELRREDTGGPGVGYSANLSGTVSADGTLMSGTWSDVNGNTGTWIATRGSGSVTLDLTGVWNVKNTPTSGPAACPEYLSVWSLIQSGTAVSGSFVWHSCIAPDSTGVITGQISGNNVELRREDTGGPGVGYSANFSGTVSADGTLMSGTWSDVNGNTGTWIATRGSGGDAPTPTPTPLPSPGGTWTQLIQNGTSIGGMAYTYDSNRNRGVIFGGDNSSLNQLSSTYEWNGTSWTLITSGGPSSRANAAMAFDTIRVKSVLFGGWVKPDNYHGDTWTWDGTQWSQVSSTGPHARANQAMAYDSSRGKVVLFGGSYYQTIYGDTWEWDGTSWTQVSSSGPSPRLFARMAYDEARGKVVLFGGQTTYYGTFLNDMWEWDGTSWTQVTVTGPSARAWHTMAYDSTRQRVVLFGGGGWGRAESFSDLWEWNGASWVQINASGPSVRIGACLFYDKTLNVMILYGGYNNGSNYSTLGDTWKYVAPVTNTAPVANAGSDQSVSVGNTVTLDGSGSTDADGNTLTYSWSFTNTPSGSTAILSDATAVNPTFTVDKAGTYVVSLIVNDGTVDSAADTVTISTLNSAPVADAGADQTPYVNDTVTLNGSGSYDVDGNLLTYSWAFTTVPQGSNAALSDATAVNPTFMVDKAGTYVVSLIVNDGTVNSAADTVTISTLNSAPVANAGADQTPYVNDTVTLNGSGSYDVDGNLLTYSWAFTTVPQGSNAALNDATAVNPTFTVDKAGTYVVSLIVNDGTVNSAADTVTISTLNSAPVANAGLDQSVYVGNTVTLDGSGSSDVDGDALTYNWSFTSMPSGSTAALNDTTSANPTFTVDKAGTYVASLIVNDGTVNSAPDTITISTINVAPVANAGNDQTVPEESTVTLDGSGSSDADGDTITYSWSFTTKPSGSTAALSGATSANPTFTADEEGTYVVSLIVNDGTVNSSPDTVIVNVTDDDDDDETPEVIEAEVEIKPETINLKSKGKFKAFIELPSPYDASNIVVETVVCEGAQAIDGRTDGNNRFVATFNTQDLVLEIDSKKEKVTLAVSGELEDGTKFTGSDTVKVKGKEKDK